MKSNLNTRQNFYLVIGIFLITMFVIGGTYAYLSHAVTTINGNIASSTTCFNINYTKGDDITGTLFPSSSSQGGGSLTGNVTFGLNANCIKIEGIANIYLNVTSGSSTLFQTVAAHCENSKTLKSMTSYTTQSTCEAQTDGVWVTNGTALKYAIYATSVNENDKEKVDNLLVSAGYIKQTGNMKIYDNFSISRDDITDPDGPQTFVYDIYIWLDGYLSDNTYQNQSFAGTISADASQVNG